MPVYIYLKPYRQTGLCIKH